MTRSQQTDKVAIFATYMLPLLKEELANIIAMLSSNLDDNAIRIVTEAAMADALLRIGNDAFMAKHCKCSSNISKPVMGLNHNYWLPLPMTDAVLSSWTESMLPMPAWGHHYNRKSEKGARAWS